MLIPDDTKPIGDQCIKFNLPVTAWKRRQDVYQISKHFLQGLVQKPILVLTLGADTCFFSIAETTLGQCDPTHFLMDYQFTITYPISVKNFSDLL